MKIAMIGLGKMGANMTQRLIEKGHQVVAFDQLHTSVATDFTHVFHGAPYRGQPDTETATQANAAQALPRDCSLFFGSSM